MKKIVALIVIIVAIGIVPIVVKNNMDNSISEYAKGLKEQGLDLEIISNSGYLNSVRKYKLTIKDSSKLRDKYLKLIKQQNDKFLTNRVFKNTLTGMKFNGEIRNSNLFLSDTRIIINLKKLSDNMMKKNNEKLNKLLDKNKISLNIKLHKSGNIKSIKLKDIQEKFLTSNGQATIRIRDLFVKLSDDKFMEQSYTANVSKIDILMYSSKSNNFQFKIKDIKSNLEFKNKYEQKQILEIGKFNIVLTDNYKTGEFTIKKTSIQSDMKLKNNMINVDMKSKFDEIAIVNDNKQVRIKHTFLDFGFYNLDKELIDAFEKYNLNSQDPMDRVIKLLNKGFDLKINLGLEDMKSKGFYSIENVRLNSDIKLLKNKLNISNIMPNIIKRLDVQSKITLTTKDAKLLNIILGRNMTSDILGNSKKEGDNFIIDITVKDGITQINEKRYF